MAMSASPPPQLPSAANDAYLEQLDDDIARVRAEIANLTKRRSLLSASLLSSTRVQSALQLRTNVTSNDDRISLDTTPLGIVDQQSLHNQVNVHRIAFGVTAFPFTDPSPETSNEPLLGIRFDIPSHNGRFDQAPYYLFCKKLPLPASTKHQDGTSSSSTSKQLTVHHHTIPAFVPLQDLLDKYLPQTSTQSRPADNNEADDEGYDSPESSSRTESSPAATMTSSTLNPNSKSKQNLHALTTAIYTHLSAQANRKAAIALLTEPMHPSLSSMSSTGEDCIFIRMVWHDGLVGRVKLNEDGFIERAVVFGDEGRMRDLERILSEDEMCDRVPIMSLKARLDVFARRRGRDMEIEGYSGLQSEED